MRIIEDEDDFKKLVEQLSNGVLVMVDFYADWCGPCKQISPKLEAMEKEFTNVSFFKVNVDDCETVAQKYEISAMPTFLFFKNGAKIDTVVGANEAKVRETIMKHK